MEGSDISTGPSAAAGDDPAGTGPARGRRPVSRRHVLAAAGATSIAAAVAGGAASTAAATAAKKKGKRSTAQINAKLGTTATYQSRPDLHPTLVTASVVRSPGAGYVFISPSGPMIVDNEGGPVWIHPVPKASTNFQVQHYKGNPVLTWWQGQIASYGVGIAGYDVIMDTSYQEVTRVHAGNGAVADLHEFVLTERGTALLTTYAKQTADLSSVGGPSSGTLLEASFQEVDVATGKVLLDWHSSDHIALTESHATFSHDHLYDPVHLNSICVLPDENLLVSARNTWAVYKVNRTSGEIMWRLGGTQSDFTLGPGVRFAWQHDAEWHAGSVLTIFDDEGNPQVGPQARAIILKVDESAKHVSLVKAYGHPNQKLHVGYAGSVQLLPNGDVFVGWGGQPYYTEYRRDGTPVLDAQYTGFSYRAYRFPWRGEPTSLPAVAAEPTDSGILVYASWNGATDVASWEVLAGATKASLKVVATAPRIGFETAVAVTRTYAWAAARALDDSGKALATSAPVAVKS